MAEAGVVRGVVAVELAGGQPPARDALGPEPGGELATRVGRDLARLPVDDAGGGCRADDLYGDLHGERGRRGGGQRA